MIDGVQLRSDAKSDKDAKYICCINSNSLFFINILTNNQLASENIAESYDLIKPFNTLNTDVKVYFDEITNSGIKHLNKLVFYAFVVCDICSRDFTLWKKIADVENVTALIKLVNDINTSEHELLQLLDTMLRSINQNPNDTSKSADSSGKHKTGHHSHHLNLSNLLHHHHPMNSMAFKESELEHSPIVDLRTYGKMLSINTVFIDDYNVKMSPVILVTFIYGLLLYICSSIIIYCKNLPQEYIKYFINILTAKNDIKVSLGDKILIARNLLRIQSVRSVVCEQVGIRNLISNCLLSGNLTMMYHASFCLWSCSFSKELFEVKIGVFYHNQELIKLWIDKVLLHREEEKIVRLNVGIINNLTKYNWLLGIYFDESVRFFLNKLMSKKWKDKDLSADIGKVVDELYELEKNLLSFDTYLSELKSGNCLNKCFHGEIFWLHHINLIEANDFEVVSTLVNIIANSDKDDLISSSLTDLYYIFKYYPHSKAIVNRFKIKSVCMKLLEHKDKNVMKNSLCILQLLIMNKT